MTEERMIRITDEEYKIWQRFVRDFDDELKEYDVPRQLWAYFESKNLEPAPPKDWRPYCFSESPIGVCGGAIDTDSLGYLGNRCKVCPYRKLE